jgi:hypothetical protein
MYIGMKEIGYPFAVKLLELLFSNEMKPHVECYIECNKYNSNVLMIKNWSLNALGLLLLKELLSITITAQTEMIKKEKKFIVKLLMKYIPNLLENIEPRVRKLCSEVLHLGMYGYRIMILILCIACQACLVHN